MICCLHSLLCVVIDSGNWFGSFMFPSMMSWTNVYVSFATDLMIDLVKVGSPMN